MADINKVGGADETNKDVISHRHPEYNGISSIWDFFLLSYHGGEAYTAANLFRYFKEGQEEFNSRVARSYRENHSRRVVDLINSYLFKEAPIRRTKNERLERFIEDADGKGNSLDHVMKEVSQFSSVLGRVYIVCDKKALPEEERTGTQADNLKTTPYIYIVYPQDMLDISIDEFGVVRWALVREQERRGEESIFTAESVLKPRYRLWEKGKWSLYDEGGKEVDSGETGIDIVPIIPVDHERRTVYSGQSLIADIAYLDRAIFNNWSRLDTIVCDQTFSQLIFPIEGMMSAVIEDKELREQFMALATNRVLLYSMQAGVPPQFISPDASQAEFILNMIQVQVKQLYASLGLQGEIATEVKQTTGVAKAYDFDKLNKLLANKADNLEAAEERLFKVVDKWLGLSGKPDIEVSYPDEFDTRGLVDELNIAERVTLLEVSDALNKALYKNIAGKALPHAPKELVKEIEKEIDEGRDKTMMMDDALKDNIDQRPANAPRSRDRVSNPKQSDYPTPTRTQSKQKAERP